jgi:hypothetical protein
MTSASEKSAHPDAAEYSLTSGWKTGRPAMPAYPAKMAATAKSNLAVQTVITWFFLVVIGK